MWEKVKEFFSSDNLLAVAKSKVLWGLVAAGVLYLVFDVDMDKIRVLLSMVGLMDSPVS